MYLCTLADMHRHLAWHRHRYGHRGAHTWACHTAAPPTRTWSEAWSIVIRILLSWAWPADTGVWGRGGAVTTIMTAAVRGTCTQKTWALHYLPKKLQNKIIQIRLFVKVRICWISLKWSLSKFCIVTKCGRSSVPVWLFVMLPSITFLIYLKLLMPLLEQVYHSLLLLLYFVSFQYWEIRIIEQNICIVPHDCAENQ